MDSAAVARLEIDEATAANPSDDLPRRAAGWPRWAIAAAVLVGTMAGVVATWVMRTPPATLPGPVSRFIVTLPATEALEYSFNDHDVAVAADGTSLAFVGGEDAQVMVRAFDRLEAVPLAGSVNARAPFFSPDGQWIGFFDRLDEGVTTGPVVEGRLRKASMRGGPPVTIAQLTGGSRGASWAGDDWIVFATSDPSTGLLRVRAEGGEPQVLTTPDAASGEHDPCFPHVLPGGRGVLFTISYGDRVQDRRVAVLDPTTGQRRTVMQSGGEAVYAESSTP